MNKVRSVLIANRGEIAIRIARTARAMGLSTVAIYSEADQDAEHIRYCDQAYCVGPAAAKESYLNIDSILRAAKKSGASFIHPGYGFLSERAQFADACKNAGITLVGPSAESMRVMGDKIEARKTVDRLGLPRVPGSAGAISDPEEARKIARQIGYPVLLKAAAGGGGKGMRRVDDEKDLEASFHAASREALSAFGDGSLYLEKWILKPHHVEIQVFGDGKGRALALGERECSIQRRHQKVWEETPSPLMERFPATREKMMKAAAQIASSIHYSGAGTLEFIADESGHFYFLEMNTRLQVEHPVTEWVTGLDLVKWQLLLAQGDFKLPEGAPSPQGASIEVRIYAEDPESFLPAPGKIGRVRWPSGPFVRVDTAYTEPAEVSMHYDPMIAKISTWGRDRNEALARLKVALGETSVLPPRTSQGMLEGSLRTNIPFLRRLIETPDLEKGDTPTDFIANHPELTAPFSASVNLEAALALSLSELVRQGSSTQSGSTHSASGWISRAREEGIRGINGGYGG